MKIQIIITEATVNKILSGIMDNFPEASRGNSMVCTRFDYDKLIFLFTEETGERHALNRHKLRKALPLVFSGKWPKGCTPPPATGEWTRWDQWLCDCDATDFDAFIQLAALGQVIYG